MKEILGDILPYAAPVLTAIAGFKWDWIMKKLNFRKETADLQGMALDNLEKNMNLYQELVTDIDKRYRERIADFEENFTLSIDKLKVEIEELKSLNLQLEKMVQEQKVFIAKQHKSLKHYETKFGKLPLDGN